MLGRMEIAGWARAVLVVAGAAVLPSGLSGEAVAGLQARIDAAEAGATVRVESGVYAGPLRIEKPLVLEGVGQPVIEGDWKGHVIHVLSDGVRISGLEIRGSGANLSRDHAGIMIEGEGAVVEGNRIADSLHGIYLKKANGSRILKNRITGMKEKLVPVGDIVSEGLRLTPDGEMCIIDVNINQRGNGIHLWNSTGGFLEGNEIEGTRDGIYFSFSDRTIVRDNLVRGVRYGLHYMYSDENVFENNRFEGNAAGSAIMYSKGLFVRGNIFANNRSLRAYGMLLNAVDDTTFIGNELRQNTVGIYVENSNNNHFRENVIGTNYIGVRMSMSSMDNTFSRNGFSRNLHSVELEKSSVGNEWSPEGVGNFWSGAQTVDLDGDGASEFAHREADLLGAYRRDFPAAGLLTRTPALQLVEMVQSRVPLPGVSAITDSAPLTRTPAVSPRD